MVHEAIHELCELHNKAPVFRDRAHAGQALAGMLEEFQGGDVIVCAIPAGGVPVGAEIAQRLGLPLEVIPVSKILFPWTTESGFGAVSFDGTEWINRSIVRQAGMDEQTVAAQVEEARAKVRRRLQRFRGGRPFPELKGRTLIAVDDGIAAGSTMRAALAALRKQEPRRLIIAVPTAHDISLIGLAAHADAIYCANIRSGYSFAVAEAYAQWCDISDDEVTELLARNESRQRPDNHH
jgi:predicted phosphoribosyltransferase